MGPAQHLDASKVRRSAASQVHMSESIDLRQELSSVIRELTSLESTVTESLNRLEALIETNRVHDRAFNKFRPEYWAIKANADSLRKIKIFLSWNFIGIESMALIALTRYVFEMTVWLKLIAQNPQYALAYFRQLIKNQLEHYERLCAHLKREIEFLQAMERTEHERLVERVAAISSLPEGSERTSMAAKLGHSLMAEIDATAARTLSLYGIEARSNGYGFQAHLVATHALPAAEQWAAQVKAEEQAFDDNVPRDVQAWIPKKWNWRDQAAKADMKHDYEFIYSYTSRLLHAEPASISINQQTLEPREVLLFLRYVKTRLADILELCANVGAA